MANFSQCELSYLADVIGKVPHNFEPKYSTSDYKDVTEDCRREHVEFYSNIQQDYEQFDDRVSSIIDFLVKLRKSNRVEKDKCKSFINTIKQKKQPKILRSPSSSYDSSLDTVSDEYTAKSKKKTKQFKVCAQHRCNVRIKQQFTKCKKHA